MARIRALRVVYVHARPSRAARTGTPSIEHAFDRSKSGPQDAGTTSRRGCGWLFRQEMVDCGKGATGRCRKCANGPGHGPYWYRYRWYDGKMHKRYVGKRLPQQDPGLSPNNATTVGVAAQVRELARTRA